MMEQNNKFIGQYTYPDEIPQDKELEAFAEETYPTDNGQWAHPTYQEALKIGAEWQKKRSPQQAKVLPVQDKQGNCGSHLCKNGCMRNQIYTDCILLENKRSSVSQDIEVAAKEFGKTMSTYVGYKEELSRLSYIAGATNHSTG